MLKVAMIRPIHRLEDNTKMDFLGIGVWGWLRIGTSFGQIGNSVMKFRVP
jgi:hypothetical protein